MKKKQMIRVVLVVMILGVMITATVTAQSPYNPTKDIWCEANLGGGCLNGFGLSTISQQSACDTQRVAFIGWDLSGVTQIIGSAELVLTSYFISEAPLSPTEVVFQLFSPSTQDWTEATTSSPGDAGTTLATRRVVLVDGATPQTVVFGGSANEDDAEALGNYLDSLRASGSATVGVRITGGCLENTVVNFNDREQSGGTAVAPPSLFLFTPTAVSLQSVAVSSQNQSAPLPAFGAAAFLALVVVTVTYIIPALRHQKRRD